MTLADLQQLQTALKEWAIAVEALTAGKTIVLLRKGGIREKSFHLLHENVWLYPTYEHQKPDLLKPEYAEKVRSVESGWHPATVEIKSSAVITDVLPVKSEERLKSLLPYHIWNQKMISDRLKWKPQQPLMVLLLRVYRLAQPQVIPYHNTYGGCKSWIDLVEPISTAELLPAIEDGKYARLVGEIKDLI
ncbi:MAG: DUF1802 family protein [Pleurocapsa sp. MO_226.B13]|nr:DUF1802 family protein [Pleurocapsa sp. MO_226.B13]